jgi:hypothetical protein
MEREERRRVPRYQFIAPAELVEETSGVRSNSWVADIGSQGCSLSISNPPSAGTVVRLKIGTDPREPFQARSIVVHSNGGHVGLLFSQIQPHSAAILEKWLASAKFPKQVGVKRVD